MTAATAAAAGKKRTAFDALMDTGGSAIRVTDKMPLYLQHQGHSRTVVGIEVASDGEAHLLMFDPGRSVSVFILSHVVSFRLKRVDSVLVR
jgi:hypothetical protein